jgi:hypothetical protein
MAAVVLSRVGLRGDGREVELGEEEDSSADEVDECSHSEEEEEEEVHSLAGALTAAVDAPAAAMESEVRPLKVAKEAKVAKRGAGPTLDRLDRDARARRWTGLREEREEGMLVVLDDGQQRQWTPIGGKCGDGEGMEASSLTWGWTWSVICREGERSGDTARE